MPDASLAPPGPTSVGGSPQGGDSLDNPGSIDPFRNLTTKEIEESLASLTALSDAFRKETSAAARQLSLGGLAFVWIFRTVANDQSSLPPFLIWPMLFFTLALTADFSYWALGALYWGLDRRWHLRDADQPRWASWIMSPLTRTEWVGSVPSVRLRPAGYLIALEILFTILGVVSMVIYLMVELTL